MSEDEISSNNKPVRVSGDLKKAFYAKKEESDSSDDDE